ncbi:MAG: hypothetical protein JWO05_2695 [Gemmatimonadetes bacterium]|nr:hypothetical protein [Gemmatimonadota bacterium]
MWVGESGAILGAVTIGGCVDARVIEAAGEVLATWSARQLVISLNDDEAWDVGLTCGGEVEVLVEPVNVRSEEDAVIRRLRDDDASQPQPRMVIVGAGHVAMALAPIAGTLGFETVVVDGRERYATSERFPGVDSLRVGMPSEIVEQLGGGAETAIVLLTHDYKYEIPVLRWALRSSVGYVGMLGSKRRAAAIRALLSEDGLTDAELARLRIPIGLDLGGKSAPEIALSIAAEVVAVRAGRTLRSDRQES